MKDPENPDHWIIDEEAAEVVRRIYRMTIEGKGPYQIARELSEEKIESEFTNWICSSGKSTRIM